MYTDIIIFSRTKKGWHSPKKENKMNPESENKPRRGRKKGSKNKPHARDIVEALYYIADALNVLNKRIPELRSCLEALKEVGVRTPK